MSNLPATTGKGHPGYEHARQIWTYIAGGNAEKTARILSQPPGEKEDSDRDAIPVPARTIREWATRFGWAEQADRDLKDFAPGVHNHVTREIVAGGIHAIEYLRDVVSNPTVEDKVRLDAAKTLLDRGGHMAWTRPKDNSRPIGPTKDYDASVAGLTAEELMARLGFALPEVSHD